MYANDEDSQLAAAAISCKEQDGEVSLDLYPFIRMYKDGRMQRFLSSPFVPADEHGRRTGVASRDVVVDQASGVSVRLFLPSRAAESTTTRLPLVVYIHGGSFCTESAFCRTYHRYAASLATSAGALVVSVEYRLAPEFPIPAAYDDAWAALQWVQMQLQQVSSSSSAAEVTDPWLAGYADPARTFLAGDSAGGNIAYHTAVRCRTSSHSDDHHNMEIEGLIMLHPYFWGSGARLPSETADAGSLFLPANRVDRLWPFVTAGMAGNDDPRIDPPDEEILSLSLTCRRVLVAVAEKDTFRDRGLRLAARMARPPSKSNVVVMESEGEDHGFHLYSPLRATSKKLMKSIVQFIRNVDDDDPYATNTPPPGPLPIAPLPLVVGAPTRPFMDVFGYGMTMNRWTPPAGLDAAAHARHPNNIIKSSPRNTNSFKPGPNKLKSYRLFSEPLLPHKHYPFSAAIPWIKCYNF